MCVPILRYSLYSVIKEQYSTRCPRGIEYPSFSDDPLRLSTLKDYIYVEYLYRHSFLGSIRHLSTLFDVYRHCPAPHPTDFDFRLSTLRTLSALSGILRPYPQVRLRRIVSNMKLSKNILTDNVETTRLSLARFDKFRLLSFISLSSVVILYYMPNLEK